MTTTILKDKLKEGVNVVERISGKSLSLPILNNILIQTEKNFLNLVTTDLEIGIKWWGLVKKGEEGKAALPARVLSSFISFLPDKPIELETKGFNLEVRCNNHETLINGVNPEDFPLIPKTPTEEKFVISSQQFCQALNQVVDIASFSSTKPEISGVFFTFQKDLITMAATDSFRLGEKKLYLKSNSNNITKDYSFILPQRAAKEIINIFGGKEGNLAIFFSPNQVLFEVPLSETAHPQIQLTSRLIEGEYPNYQEIIPQKYETRVIFQIKELINQIKLASLFSGKVNEIKLKISPQQKEVSLSSQNPEVGGHKSSFPAKVEGRACEISFNDRFLLDGLLKVSSGPKKEKEAVFELSGPDKPGVIKSKGDDSFIYLVMPIKSS